MNKDSTYRAQVMASLMGQRSSIAITRNDDLIIRSGIDRNISPSVCALRIRTFRGEFRTQLCALSSNGRCPLKVQCAGICGYNATQAEKQRTA